MAGEMDHIRKVRDDLNKVSPSFCLAKWLQVSLHLGLSGDDKTKGAGTHSCHHPLQHAVPLSEIQQDPAALHNTQYKKEQMQKMLDGERPEECNYCWNIEDLDGDHLSDRSYKSADSSWAGEARTQQVLDNGTNNINPTYVEVSFSNVCNFKCSYCSPTHSSQWVHEIEKHGPYKTSTGFNDLTWLKKENRMPLHHKEDNPYLDAFWEWWPELIKTLEVFRITGGEPLLDKNTFKVMDKIIADDTITLNELSINTNACVPTNTINAFVAKMKKVEDTNRIKITRIYTSVDAYGKQAEYGRTGLDYNQWLGNVDKMLTDLPNTKITIMCTANVFSVTNFKQMLNDVYDLKIKHFNENRKVPITIDVSGLRWPGHQCAAILPAKYSKHLEESLTFMKDRQEGVNGNDFYKGFFDYEIERLARFIEYMKGSANEISHLPTAMKDFYIFVNEHDKRRGTNFLQTFPELSEFYNDCKKENDMRII